jgi:hypothetical protein
MMGNRTSPGYLGGLQNWCGSWTPKSQAYWIQIQDMVLEEEREEEEEEEERRQSRRKEEIRLTSLLIIRKLTNE